MRFAIVALIIAVSTGTAFAHHGAFHDEGQQERAQRLDREYRENTQRELQRQEQMHRDQQMQEQERRLRQLEQDRRYPRS